MYIYFDDVGIKEIKKEVEYIMFIYYILWNDKVNNFYLLCLIVVVFD